MSTLISKAFNRVVKAATGSLSSYVVGAPPQYGQPIPTAVDSSDAQGLITPQRQRELVAKTPTAAACLNAILDFSTSVPILSRNVDAAKPIAPGRKKFLDNLLNSPNKNDTGLHLKYQTYRDMTTLGFAAWELERDVLGKPANLWGVDAARLRIDFDEHGTILGYDTINAHGMPTTSADGTHAWKPQDIIFFKRDPISLSLYPTSRLNQLWTCAIIEDLMLYFISGRFTDSNTPYGVFDMGEITDTQLKEAIRSWNTQVSTGHRIMLTGSKGSKWYPFGYHLKELEATQLLAEVRGKIMAVMGVTMNELGESQDVNKSNGYNLSYTFKKRGVEPLLNEFCTTLTKRLVWDELGWTDVELYYEEIDSRDELLQSQIDTEYMKAGVWSINHVKNRKGLPSVPGGELDMVFTGSAWIPVDTLDDFAQAQLQAIQAAVTAEGAAGGGGPISPPLTRGPQSPEKYTTPDGQGSSTTKIKYGTGSPTKPRGGKSALQRSGLRTEDNK